MISYLYNKKRVFFLSAIFAFALIFILGLCIFFKPPPKKRPESANVPAVNALHVSKLNYTVYAKAYGTVQPAKTLMLNAPFTGEAVLSGSFQKGSYIPQDYPLFQIDIEHLSNQKQALNINLEELNIKEKKLLIEDKKTEKELINAQNLKKLIDAEIQKMEERKLNSASLHAKAKSLYMQQALSEKHFLEEENKFKDVELGLIQVKKSQQKNTIILEKLSLHIDHIDLEKFEIQKAKEKIKLKIKTLIKDIKKASIQAPENSQILDLFVEERQEVSRGTPLAKLNLLGEVSLPISLPDYYFKWLYSGPLLKDKQKEQAIEITLVNPHYKKVFQDGYIKSIAGSLDPKTRSLSIIIGKNNPLSKEGFPISQKELLPGSYCFVMLPLDLIKDVYIIPRSSIQRDGSVYLIDDDDKILKSSCKILFEAPDGVVVRIDCNQKQVLVVTHITSALSNGMTVQWNDS